MRPHHHGFYIGFPRTRVNHDAIWEIIDRLTKSAHFLPVSVRYTLERSVKMYINEVVSKHRVPVLIVLDRDEITTSRFGQAFQECFGTKLNLNTVYHS